jgi:hypothetical protein
MPTLSIPQRISRLLAYLAILTGTVLLGAAQPCFADQFNYIVSESISSISSSGIVLLGTVTGDFTINTTGVAYNYGNGDGTPNYSYRCSSGDPACALVSFASLTWTPQGGNAQNLEVSPFVSTLLGANDGWDAVGECAFTSGEACNFQLGADGGFLNFQGTLGQNLNGDVDELCAVACFSGGFGGQTLEEGTAMVTPEPGTFVLASCGLILLLAVRRIFPRLRAN